MRILYIENSKKPNGIEIRGLLGDAEFKQLVGNLDFLCVFATRTIIERATCIKTGARHSFAKYLLFPVKLRRQFKTDQFDFEKMNCGFVHYRDKVYVIYEVPRKV
ncbi:hypothetical protein MYX82_08485 [Acidobacteria bacterium AH-259-D05]|nr:hypothetical protein [Acidobacteria bacterium AH-259-D05]